jgi:23S rRNA (uracil1939-C5)-methyltransferase
MATEVPVTIQSMAFKGYGVSRKDGKVVFVPYVIAGEEVWIEMVEEKKDYSIGRPTRISSPSSWRVEPRCPYFGVCGGCQWQHIDSRAQAEFKKEILKDILRRLGRLTEIPPISVIPSPQPYGYRTRIQLKVEGGSIGYYRVRSHHLVDVDHCPIAHPLVNQALRSLRQVRSIFNSIVELEINVSPDEGRGILILRPNRTGPTPHPLLPKLLNDHPVFKGCAIVGKKGSRLWGDSFLTFTVSFQRKGKTASVRLQTSPESFFQVNLEQNRSLVQTVLDFADLTGSERVLDLYAGVGNFSLPLAVDAREVLAIEENDKAVEDGRLNVLQNRIERCQFIAGKVEEAIREFKDRRWDIVVLDPPRSGCKAIIPHLVEWKPQKIIYVSCDPATLARDLRLLLEKGYALQDLRLIDLFPQTYHLEVVGLLTQPEV